MLKTATKQMILQGTICLCVHVSHLINPNDKHDGKCAAFSYIGMTSLGMILAAVHTICS